MNGQATEMTIKDVTANPAPLGLLGFGLTTILLNLHNAGFYGFDSMILAMGIFVGGIAQVIAGIMEWKKGNTFGTTAFIAYGMFWLSLVFIVTFPGTHLGSAPTPVAMGFYLLVWGIFSLGMFIGTLKLSMALRVVFFTLVILFFLLAIGDFSGSSLLKTIAGYEGIICGCSAVYTALAQILNEIYKKRLLPV